jgi:hypothetical protein
LSIRSIVPARRKQDAWRGTALTPMRSRMTRTSLKEGKKEREKGRKKRGKRKASPEGPAQMSDETPPGCGSSELPKIPL